MPRFQDDWVVDRTMFEYVSGGSCACCGFPHFYPDGVAGMINAISDMETDAARAEISAIQTSPWPPDMRDQVWADRVRLRHKLKKEMPTYKKFWQHHGEAMASWCRETATPTSLKMLLQMPRSGVTERLNSVYGIHSAYGVVLCTVTEQVSRFKVTGYPTDARGDDSEIGFEEALVFDRRGGFTLNISNADGTLNQEVLNVWLERMKSLGGPKLLDRGPSTARNEDDEDEGGGADEGQERDPEDTKPGPSFRGDRRIVRLLIARYWADMFIKQHQKHVETEKKSEEEAVKTTATDNSTNGVAQVESMTKKLSMDASEKQTSN